MKQQITNDQLNELNDAQAHKLLKWLISKGDIIVTTTKPELLTNSAQVNWFRIIGTINIGRMIEFLEEFRNDPFFITRRYVDWKISYNDKVYGRILNGELCDFLWEAIKDCLKDVSNNN